MLKYVYREQNKLKGEIMDLKNFKESLVQNKPKPVYLFYGNSEFLMEEALKWYKEYLTNLTSGNISIEVVQEETELDELVENANTIPLFCSNKLIVHKNPNYFTAKKRENGKRAEGKIVERFLEYLKNPNPATFIVLLVEGKPDSRKKIFQALHKENMVLELNQLKGRSLQEWVAERFIDYNKKITPQALDYLISVVGTDLSLLEQEITKLVLFAGERQDIHLEMVEELVSKTAQATIFNLVDAVAEGRGVDAVKHCQELLNQGEKEMFIVYMLTRQFRIISEAKLLVAKGYGQGQLSQILQIPEFAVRKALKQGHNFSIAQLAAIMDKLLSLDVAIKTGKGNPNLLLEMIIVELCA